MVVRQGWERVTAKGVTCHVCLAPAKRAFRTYVRTDDMWVLRASVSRCNEHSPAQSVPA